MTPLTPREEKMLVEFGAALLIAPIVKIELPAVEAVAVIGQLQLALRHPENKGSSVSDIAHHLIEEIRRQLDHPAIQRVIDAGFNPNFDGEAPGQ
jgi:hypothetical protein